MSDYTNIVPTAPPTYPTSTCCEDCTFPFVFGDGIFDTCINVQDVDTQPWCLYKMTATTNEGTHILPPPPKLTCSDSDSSCPSTPKTVISSLDYRLNYPTMLIFWDTLY